ncbi:serine/threonine-protein kinase pakF isoform X1 [Jatropha curcas]|uniref:serine/threonine-protein kinase pakF isoform X1 n=1 Tax=Jatropha curcas TaxID=180498 RepID=UPI001893F0F2|nr:serine/threonine-protein kinase pakF isoform X1 [Jatropha curcas]
MADSEKLTALKKAYADIILNTAKEAAARIMVSERKAQRYQRELFAAKDEALRMLLRLKQMLDSKVSEAEMVSLTQQRRIEELEAQLGEAEDIVKDLRAELRELQDELEKVTNRQMQPLSEQNSGAENATLIATFEENRLSTSWSVISSLPALQCDPVITHEMKNSTFNGTFDGSKCYSGHDCHKDNCFVCSPDFASIVMRSKEPELYRNGCTQRIRAFERNLLGGNLSLSRQAEEKNQIVIREEGEEEEEEEEEDEEEEKEEDKDIYKELTAKVDNVCDIEVSTDIVKDVEAGNKCRKRKRKRNRNLSLSGQADGIMDQLSMREEDKHICSNLTSKVDNGCDTEKSLGIVKDIPRRLRRKRAARYRRHTVYKSFPLPAVDNDLLTGEDSRTIDDIPQKDPKLSLSNKNETITQVTKSDAEFDRTCLFQNRTDDKLSIDVLELTGQDAGSAESSEFPASKTDFKIASVLLSNSNPKEPDVIESLASQPMNKFLYTFQRKRKKESPSSPDGDSSIDNGTLKRKTVGKQIGYGESQKSGLIAESSRDTRKMAQVARQLISLSEKKWW